MFKNSLSSRDSSSRLIYLATRGLPVLAVTISLSLSLIMKSGGCLIFLIDSFLEGIPIVIRMTLLSLNWGRILLLLRFTRSLFVRFFEWERNTWFRKELCLVIVLPRVAMPSSLTGFLDVFESPCLMRGSRGSWSLSLSSLRLDNDFFLGEAVSLSSLNRLKLRALKFCLRL